jgi:hypothetical protein
MEAAMADSKLPQPTVAPLGLSTQALPERAQIEAIATLLLRGDVDGVLRAIETATAAAELPR